MRPTATADCYYNYKGAEGVGWWAEENVEGMFHDERAASAWLRDTPTDQPSHRLMWRHTAECQCVITIVINLVMHPVPFLGALSPSTPPTLIAERIVCCSASRWRTFSLSLMDASRWPRLYKCNQQDGMWLISGSAFIKAPAILSSFHFKIKKKKSSSLFSSLINLSTHSSACGLAVRIGDDTSLSRTGLRASVANEDEPLSNGHDH